MDEIVYSGAGHITKASRNPDGTVTFEASKAAGPDLDGDEQILDPAWLDKAMGSWFQTGGNLREQHGHVAAGKALTLEQRGGGDNWVSGMVVDPGSAAKVEHGVLQGLSVGIKGARVVKDAAAPGGRIVDGRIVEVSLVDRPCNPTCKLQLAKADGAGNMLAVEELVVDEIDKREFSSNERDQAAKGGQAMSDGSFPIKNESDLKNAISAVGRAKNPAAAKAHIRQRAKALGLTNLIPDSWGSSGSDDGKKADLPDITKADSPEVAAARQALAPLVQALSKEIDDLAAGDLGEQFDISRLTDAISSISQFLAHEVSEQPDADQGAVPLYLSDQPDAAKADQPDPAEEASDMTEEQTRALFKTMLTEAVADLQKAATAGGEAITKVADAAAEIKEGPDLGALITEAVTKAVEPLQTGLAEVTSKIDDMPAPGGPVVTRTTQQVQKSDQAELRAEYLRKSQDPTLTQNLRDGYAAMAAQLPS